MIQFLIDLTVPIAWIWGVKCLFNPGYLLEKVSDWIENNLPVWIYKPTIGCAACMSSLHGLLWFFVGIPLFFDHCLHIKLLIPFLICLCGINYLLIKYTDNTVYVESD